MAYSLYPIEKGHPFKLVASQRPVRHFIMPPSEQAPAPEHRVAHPPRQPPHVTARWVGCPAGFLLVGAGWPRNEENAERRESFSEPDQETLCTEMGGSLVVYSGLVSGDERGGTG